MRRYFHPSAGVLLLAAAGLLQTGCSNTAYLAQGEKLYTGAEVNVESKSDLPRRGELEEELDVLARPEPNGKFLGLFRVKLWLYNVGIFSESLGEPPVLLGSVAPERVAAKMRTLLDNKGHFRSSVHYTVIEGEHTGAVRYTLEVESPYAINSPVVSGDDSPLVRAIRSTMGETLLDPGDPYDLDKLRQERERIDGVLKDMGYFHFAPDFIVFQADTTAGNRRIDLSLRVKKDIPPEATRVHTVGQITIISGYSLNRDSSDSVPGDTVFVDGLTYVDLDGQYDPDVLVRSVFFRTGAVSRRMDHDLTLNRLMDLGAFKFVNIRYAAGDSAGMPRLDVTILLTPLVSKNIRLELQGVSKSNNLVGPVFASSFRNRNLFGGAERFTLSSDIGYETPISGGGSGGDSYEIGLRGELVLPKFLTPFRLGAIPGLFVPRTRIALGAQLLHRLQYYKLVSVDASFGYTWRQSRSQEHTLVPLSVTFAHLSQATPKFEELLKTNPLLGKSFEEQWIIGQKYSYTYNDQLETASRNQVYFKGSIDLSGNLLHLVQSVFTERAATPADPYTIFGVPYSEFYRLDIDARHYYNTAGRTSSIATRLIAGLGVAYGNSSTLPYVKQFFIGGSNSVRAFVARGLGPGSYKSPDNVDTGSMRDQAGDITLAASTEYRFPIVSVVKGALFLDAGNIWSLRDDPARPGGMFSGRTFFDEMAVGTGFGLRIDLSFFVLRFDLAFPLRMPSRPTGDRWVVDRINVGSPSWRKENLVLNIAIGYPY